MDNILTRKLFKDKYLQTVNKKISHFKNGGLASLRAKHFQVGGPVYSEGERQAMILGPIASSLLTGTRQPGQSQLGAVASNIGAGIPGAINTALQIGKVEEAARKKPEFKTVYNTKTGETEFRTTEEISANRDILKPAEGFPEQIAIATTAREKAKATGESRAKSTEALNYADTVVKTTSRLVNDITNPQTATGVVGDATLFLGGVSGALDQIVSKDPDYNFGKFKSLLDDPQLGKLFDSVKSQQAKTTLVNLAYMQAKAADPSGKISDQDLKLRLKSLGESADKPAFVAGLQRSALDAIEPAITNYQRSHNLKEDELPPQYQHILKAKQSYFGQPAQEQQKQPKSQGTTDTLSPANLFKLKPAGQ